MKKIIIKRIFKDKSDILRWNYKRSFKAFLKELRDLESFTSLSKLFHSLTALYENVRWPVDVLNLGTKYIHKVKLLLKKLKKLPSLQSFQNTDLFNSRLLPNNISRSPEGQKPNR